KPRRSALNSGCGYRSWFVCPTAADQESRLGLGADACSRCEASISAGQNLSRQRAKLLLHDLDYASRFLGFNFKEIDAMFVLRPRLKNSRHQRDYGQRTNR